MQIPVKRLHPDARLPVRAHASDAGADLFALDGADEEVDYRPLHPGERRLFRTGIALAVPEGWYGRIAPRSGLSVKQGIDVMAGVIDSGFLGEVQVLLVNLGRDPVWIKPGDRLCQLIIERCEAASFEEVTDLEQSARGAGGFGSTG